MFRPGQALQNLCSTLRVELMGQLRGGYKWIHEFYCTITATNFMLCTNTNENRVKRQFLENIVYGSVKRRHIESKANKECPK